MLFNHLTDVNLP